LIEASYWGFHEVVSLLLEGRADVNQRDDQGFSCLLLASSSKHHEVVELLLAAGTDENEKQNAETTLLRMPNGIGMKQRTNCSWKL
jgi:ankyrin repeat protein